MPGVHLPADMFDEERHIVEPGAERRDVEDDLPEPVRWSHSRWSPGTPPACWGWRCASGRWTGKDADLLVVAGEPLADVDVLTRVVAVFKSGIRIR